MRDVTLCLLVDEKSKKVTLGMKKEGFGAGNLNGFGGKPKPEDQNLYDTAIRELFEEAKVSAQREYLKKVGEMTFIFPAKPDWNQCMHVYLVRQWTGEPQETKEMRPEDHHLDSVPYDKMWEADQHWMPHVLTGHYVTATFTYTEDQKLLSTELEKRPL